MLDVVIKGGTVVDGTGAPSYTADVGVRDGRIVEIGTVREPADQVLDADGALVTPGWVDVHTHYDGQVDLGRRPRAVGLQRCHHPRHGQLRRRVRPGPAPATTMR